MRPKLQGEPVPVRLELTPKGLRLHAMLVSAVPSAARGATAQQSLRENARLRVLKGNALASAPISHYDDFVLSHTKKSFLKVARIVGSSFGQGPDHKAASICFTSCRRGCAVPSSARSGGC